MEEMQKSSETMKSAEEQAAEAAAVEDSEAEPTEPTEETPEPATVDTEAPKPEPKFFARIENQEHECIVLGPAKAVYVELKDGMRTTVMVAEDAVRKEG